MALPERQDLGKAVDGAMDTIENADPLPTADIIELGSARQAVAGQ